MPVIVKIALFGASDSSRSHLAAELKLALAALAAPAAFNGLDSAVFCDVYQPCLSAEGSFMLRDFQLCFLLALQSKAESPGSPELALIDGKIRQKLNDCERHYAVLYGSTKEQLATIIDAVSLQASNQRLIRSSSIANSTKQYDFQADTHAAPSWHHACEACDDPQSERKLLSDLISGRSKTASVD